MSKQPDHNQLALIPRPTTQSQRSSSPASVEFCHSLMPSTIEHTQSVSVTDNPTVGFSTSPMCFRIANVPSTWSETDLVEALNSISTGPSLEQTFQLSLYPACCGYTQTALLSLATCTQYFQDLERNVVNHVKTPDGTLLAIDSHFYGMTPLNEPKDDIVAESVPFQSKTMDSSDAYLSVLLLSLALPVMRLIHGETLKPIKCGCRNFCPRISQISGL